MLQSESLDEKTFDLIRRLLEKEYLNEFFLVGGTGLALQIGHRKSDDIDLFSISGFDQVKTLENLESDFGFSMDYMEANTLKGSIDGIKVDLLTHGYRHIKPPVNFESIRIASPEDICAMKINAICNDGTRVKDFIDIYYLMRIFTLTEIIEFYKNKYELRNPFHALKSLNYFSEVETGDWPVLISCSELTWQEVMDRIDQECKAYSLSLRR
jgi:hypothetical protein